MGNGGPRQNGKDTEHPFSGDGSVDIKNSAR